MTLYYRCSGCPGSGSAGWEGRIRLLAVREPYEMEIITEGSCFHAIVGKYAYGNYLCIPGRAIGSELADLKDRFWNTEKLMETELSERDACSIADALAALGEYIQK